jgi:hypothetical protein
VDLDILACDKRPVEYSSETLVIRSNCSLVTFPNGNLIESFERLLGAVRKHHVLNDAKTLVINLAFFE